MYSPARLLNSLRSPEIRNDIRGGKAIQDYWRELKTATRKFCKGWGANTQSQTKKDKKVLLEKINAIDRDAESRVLDASQWQTRYALEADWKQFMVKKNYT
jgi:hypothetical protein